MKVQDLAKELRKPTKEFIRFLGECDIKVKSPKTRLDDDTVETIKSLFNENKEDDGKEVINEDGSKTVTLPDEKLTVGELATHLKVALSEIMANILQKGLLLNLNSEIDHEMAQEIALELEIDLKFDGEIENSNQQPELKAQLDEMFEAEIDANPEALQKRPPVITVMGHVDHGKTQLLDTIRQANIVAKEAGGITQHIGAYQITAKDNVLTFLDTPGHEAFTSLRARGAQVTDLAILVVAADDGVKPQTVEALNHAKAANVPIIVALNKTDKPEADLEKCKQQLSQHDLLAEDWGGKVVMMPVSAKTGDGVDALLDMIILSTDLMELQSDPTALAKGVIIESNLSKQKGPLATVLVKTGTLRVGDHFGVEAIYGKVRALLNDKGESVTEAGPGTPVELLGLSKVPPPGDILVAHANERAAKIQVDEKKELGTQHKSSKKTVSLETLSQQIEDGSIKTLNLIIKADVNGSLEAIIASIEKIPTDEVSIHILHTGTGHITENDVLLARASSAFIICFDVQPTPEAKQLATEDDITIKEYKIIYEILDDVKKAVEGLFKVTYEEVEGGVAEVRDLFKFSKVGIIAGCNIKTGVMKRNALARVTRGKELLYEGKLNSLKRFKEDVKEVGHGYECGIVMDGFTGFKEGDLISSYELQEIRRTL
ncbi:translation initiation factor IF-2 [bacterium]|nr:translation initiation factor IF-2 [bacterium]